MLVYGDIERIEDAHAVAAEIDRRMDHYRMWPPGRERHQALVAALIRAGELVQGLVDAEFSKTGHDDVSERRDAGDALLQVLGKATLASWSSGFTAAAATLDERLLQALSLAEPIRIRQAEGYAFYALYPEAYIAAAQQSGLGPDTTVIGIRSIGTSLAAMVAAALGTSAHHLRPTGHPFDRRVAIGERLAARLLAGSGPYAVVDEGPGLSGSSFNGVADWLVAHGVAEHRIHFFPSHAGDLGDAARPEHRQRWSSARKHVMTLDQIVIDAARPEHRLESWISAELGRLSAPLQDVSGGNWRLQRGDAADRWPPADPAVEKRKFLAVVDGRQWLVKFAGIGRSGEIKLHIARQLAAAGFAPAPLGLCHGFMLMPWVEHQNAAPSGPPLDRVLDYLAFRANLPTTGSGAPIAALFDMAIHNIGQRLGETAAAAARAVLPDPARFTPVPCCTDSRMHRWEWVHTAAGVWYKLDGVDHHAAHDLVGCQDIAWDVAGAAVELGLAETDRDAFSAALGMRIGRSIEPQFLAAIELCYLGFQIGLWTMALARNGDAEKPRIERLLSGYERRLCRVLGLTWVKS